MYIYLASSWRNPYQPELVKTLRENNFDVYDFRDEEGLSWKEIDPDFTGWDVKTYREMLFSDKASEGFNRDLLAMQKADIFVLLLPCGKSAHIEAGWAVGKGKKLYVYIPENEKNEPDLMYRLVDSVGGSVVINDSELLFCLTEDRVWAGCGGFYAER